MYKHFMLAKPNPVSKQHTVYVADHIKYVEQTLDKARQILSQKL